MSSLVNIIHSVNYDTEGYHNHDTEGYYNHDTEGYYNYDTEGYYNYDTEGYHKCTFFPRNIIWITVSKC